MIDDRRIDPRSMLVDVLSRHRDAGEWVGQRFETAKRLSNATLGDVGQCFLEELCSHVGFDSEFPRDATGKRLGSEAWDMRIEGRTFELKTATEEVNGSFQFNHIRYHRDYEALLCIGISPSDIFVSAWTKAEVATGGAGHLVSMDKGTSATYKLTKRSEQLHQIDEFEDVVLDVLTKLGT